MAENNEREPREDPAKQCPPAGVPRRSAWRKVAGLGVAVVFAGAEIAALTAAGGWAAMTFGRAWIASQDADVVVPGVRIEGTRVGGLTGTDLEAVALSAGLAATAQPLTLVAGPVETETTRSELGAQPDPSGAVEAALAVGRTGSFLQDLRDRLTAAHGGFDFPVGYRFDEGRALERLLALAPSVEQPSLPTQLDYDARKVVQAERGTALLAYDSMSSIATGLAQGSDRIELFVADKPLVEDRLAAVADQLDISIVLGSFDTPYMTDKTQTDRNHNLKVGATAIDGTVLMPGDIFYFNTVVGDRSAENGYRYATGISAGQLIDVLGGGICQVSSTLFGAGFFGGLEILWGQPHSRPSSYVDMGLDSTVAFPTIDMRLKNTYEFPVVLHMTVLQGRVHAEVLGPRRPYQITFERELVEKTSYNTVWRDDARLKSGTQKLIQRGRRGFKLKRYRKFLQGGVVVKTEERELNYPATTEIFKRGTNPAGEVPEEKVLPKLREPSPRLKITQ